MSEERTALEQACEDYAEWCLRLEDGHPAEAAKERLSTTLYKLSPDTVHAVLKILFNMLPGADIIEITVIKHDYGD